MGLVITWLSAVEGVLTVLLAQPTPPSCKVLHREASVSILKGGKLLPKQLIIWERNSQLAMPSHSKSVSFYFRYCVGISH